MYGLVLMMCGALAFQASGMKTAARSALIVGNGGAALAFLLAGGCGMGAMPQRGEKNYRRAMICVHLAIVYPAFLGLVIGWRLWKAMGNAEKAYLVPYLAAMCAASLVTTLTVVAAKPKKQSAGGAGAGTSEVSKQNTSKKDE